MLLTLLAKDLRRVWRNPVPWAVSLVVPFVITALIGMIFGPRSGGGGGLGTIRLAVVDEDDTALTEFLRGAMEQMRTGDSRDNPPFDLQAEFLEHDDAVHRITENELAAAVIIPKGFTEGFLENTNPITLRLIKNPARAIHPRIVEEMLGVLVTAMNAFKELAGDQLADVREMVESDDDFLTKLALAGGVLVEARQRLEPVRAYLTPPLITFAEEERADAAADDQNSAPGFNIFGFILAGMAAMFLLYLADNAMRDLYREARFHTLERFKTLHEGLLVFLGTKIVFAMAVVLLGAVILFGGGALIFQIDWQKPVVLVVLVLAYAFCGSGLMGLFSAVAGTERRADVLGNIAIMTMAIVGGCMFPPEVFPAFLREFVTPLMPTGWFATAVRGLQQDAASAAWIVAVGKLVLVGFAALVIATMLFRRRLEQGVRV